MPLPASVRRTYRLTVAPALAAAFLAAVLTGCADDPVAPLPTARAAAAPRRLLVPATYTQVSAALTHPCALTDAGAIDCWGSDFSYQVYRSDEGNFVDVPASAPTGTGYTQLSVNHVYGCALTAAGAVACWGRTGSVSQGGQVYTPWTIPTGTGYTQVSTSETHACALTGAGAIVCWGDNGAHQLEAPAGTGFTQVSAGYYQSCALTGAGAITCWGDNYRGPTPAPAGTGYRQVSVGHDAGCALTAAGTITCWGFADFGLTTPPAGGGYTQVSVAYGHACALTGAGAITCWGLDNYDQVGRTPAGTGFRQVSAEFYGSCALTTAGGATCWGYDNYGNDAPALPAPTRVLPTATFTAPATAVAGQPFTLALTGAQVPGHAEATAFTYAFDCGDGAGYAPAAAAPSASCPTTAAGPRAVRGRVTDPDGDTVSYAATVTVVRAAQAITFTSIPPAPALVGGRYAVTATGGASGQPVGFSSLTPATCAVAGSTVTLAAAGPCTVAADQAGTAAYDAAPRQTQTFTIAAPAPAFPRTPVLDRFARADGTLGSGWGGFAAPAFFRVQGQQGVVSLGGGIGWAGGAFGPTQEAFVTFASLGGGTGASAQGLVLKGQDPRDHTLGALTVTYDPKVTVVRVSALRSKPTAVTTYPVLSVRLAAGDQLGARATAAGAVEVYRNGTRVGTVTLNAADQAYFGPRGGYAGLLYVGASGARFDDFGGGTIAP